MRELQPGQNQPIGAGRVVVGVSGEPREDFEARTQIGAVLLGADGQARAESDLVSAEQPRSSDGSVTFAGYPPAFRIELDAAPAGVTRIAIVLTVKPGMPPGTTFSVFTAIRAWLTDAADKPQFLFPLPPAGRGETAMIMAELYRHQGQWKFRAVGQGFAAGLPALATHFGLQAPPTPSEERSSTGPGARRGPQPSAGLTSFSGTGFCIHPEGYILTNHHVIEGAREILARSPRQRCRLELVFADPSNDLALLRAEKPWPGVATFRDGRQAQLGEAVIVIGYPLGGLLGSGPQVTTGNVSSLIGPGDDTRSLQFTAPIQSGNSGGPVLDSDGAVVGVVSSKLNAARVHEMTGDIPQNVNFAIKAALARSFLEAVGVDCQDRVARSARSTADIAAEARDFVVKIECQG
ncbi:MAG: trypsin-like peptidase domain-containing protein [Gammaproteobacteria bacterium]|nr:trypsin-like peptidase domain-containing protein [Gammaproteobacteria bacterium]MCP5195366.1 trypsin-like peptidase domain-containing protein [Gammaproteobacteria bacterium]